MDNKIEVNDIDLPGLFQSADNTSNFEQKRFFRSIGIYLILLIVASVLGYLDVLYNQKIYKISAAIIFLLTLAIIIWRKVQKPDNIWYNGRAVAESVKTRSWRYMMGAEPYFKKLDSDITRKLFIEDLKVILRQNESLIKKIGTNASLEDPITDKMNFVRSLSTVERFKLYRTQRITNQALWYNKKVKVNKIAADCYFWIMVIMHITAILLILCTISEKEIKLPIGIFSAIASSILTWLQSKKYSELISSYSLTAHEIILMKSEIIEINENNESDFSDYVINCETAFSREHTQWYARKLD